LSLPANSGQKQSNGTMADVDFLTDTDVLIEFLRGSARAGMWLRTNQGEVLGIPVLALMEILQGARNRRDQRMLAKQLNAYTIIHLDRGDSEQALSWFEEFHLSHDVGILDCFIAAIAVRIGKPFYTFNLKHFQVFPVLDAREPYERL
jgi:predicted nucleic acid-binding protein